MKRILLVAILLAVLANGCTEPVTFEAFPSATASQIEQLPCPTVTATATVFDAGQVAPGIESSVEMEASSQFTLAAPSGPTPDATEIYRREQMLLGVNLPEPLPPTTTTVPVNDPNSGVLTVTPCP